MQIKRVLCDPTDFTSIYELEDGTKVSWRDPNYPEVARMHAKQTSDEINNWKLFKEQDAAIRAFINGCDKMDNAIGALNTQLSDISKEHLSGVTLSSASSCCTASNLFSENYTDSCCSIRSNAASVREVEEVQKNVDELDFEVNKMQEEINEKLNWQTICLYITWAMIIVIGFMIYFKSFDVLIDVNNPIQNQEIILEHAK